MSSNRKEEGDRKQCFPSKRRTKREFAPNLKVKRFWLEEENRFVTLKVSAAGMRTINKNGLAATLKAAQEKGLIDIY